MQRHPENPIIRPRDVKPSAPGLRVRGAFNPGAVRVGEEVILLLRVAEDCEPAEGVARVPVVRLDDGAPRTEVMEIPLDHPQVRLKDTRGIVYRGRDYLSTLSHLRLARSRDGVHFQVDERPFLLPADTSERFGVEDARIVHLEGRYWITYTAVSPDGWATALASTTDFQRIERHGLIFTVQNKDVAIFPRRIGGRFHALHRPDNHGFGRPSIWYADSPDLLHWGNHRCIARPRDTRWESMKIGGGAPCIETPEGWLQLYHGKGEGQRYSLFALLLDRDEPWRVVRRARRPFLEPEAPYETQGFFGNVVFTNGVVTWDDGRVFVYYGAADESVCLLETTIDELLASLY
jgi:predicted GH43/DUF377 family glycosyl hydrolase